MWSSFVLFHAGGWGRGMGRGQNKYNRTSDNALHLFPPWMVYTFPTSHKSYFSERTIPHKIWCKVALSFCVEYCCWRNTQHTCNDAHAYCVMLFHLVWPRYSHRIQIDVRHRSATREVHVRTKMKPIFTNHHYTKFYHTTTSMQGHQIVPAVWMLPYKRIFTFLNHGCNNNNSNSTNKINPTRFMTCNVAQNFHTSENVEHFNRKYGVATSFVVCQHTTKNRH